MNIFKRQFWENNLWYGENDHKRLRSREFRTSLMMPDVFRVWGADFSHWNPPPVDFQRMKDVYGMKFVILKGCDGSLNSRYYEENKAAAKAAGLPFGMYVWLYPNNKVSIDAQVNAWYARFASDPPPLGIFIDAEWTMYAGQSANPTSADLRMAHDKWRAKSGVRATTYTAAGYANTYLTSFDWSKEELWIANYGVVRPMLPIGADGYTWWQFTATLDGKLLDPKGNFELDGNYFNGDEYLFNQRFSGGGVPPGDNTMPEKYIVIWEQGCNTRPAPSTNNNYIKVLPKGTQFDAKAWFVLAGKTAQQEEWGQLTDNTWVALTYNSAPRAVPVTVEPPVEPPPASGLPDTLWIGETAETVKEYKRAA